MTVFFENSTRTRVSFEVAGKWMSADVINVSASSSSVSKGESLRDTAMTLRAAGADALIVRHPASGAAHQIAAWTGAAEDGGPAVINAGDGTARAPHAGVARRAHSPAATRRHRGSSYRDRRRHPAQPGVPARTRCCSRCWCRGGSGAPQTLLPVGVETWPVRVSHSIDAELPGLDAVLMLRVQAERMNGGFFPSPREYSITYGLNEKRLGLLPDHAVVLHPGPMLRGMEIASSVADSARTAVLQQVTNGVHVRMAVRVPAAGGNGRGRVSDRNTTSTTRRETRRWRRRCPRAGTC